MATDIQWGWAGHTMVDLRWDQIDLTRQACTLGVMRIVSSHVNLKFAT